MLSRGHYPKRTAANQNIVSFPDIYHDIAAIISQSIRIKKIQFIPIVGRENPIFEKSQMSRYI